MTGAIVLQIFLIFCNAVFACAEIAVISMSEVKLEKLVKEGNKRAGRLMRLTENPAGFLATIQVAITLAGFLGSAYAADHFAQPLVEWILGFEPGIPPMVLNSACVFLITLLIAYFSIVFGELVPKRMAMHRTESVALGLSGILTVVARLFRPIVWLLTVSTNGLLRLIGINPQEEEEVTEEEIRLMVAAGSEKGAIDEDENEMIQNVFEFNDTAVEEICTHRVDVIRLDCEDTLEEWDEVIYSSRHNHYPICGRNSDDVLGILDAKEYLRMSDRSRECIMKQAVKKPFLVPENMKADALFRRMKQLGVYFAVVVDEYGGMSGIVTMQDLLEVLVGDLPEQEEPCVEEIVRAKEENSWIIQGTAPLEEVAEELSILLPTDEYDTFSGYICGRLGQVPEDGSCFTMETDRLTVKVNSVQERRIKEAVVIRKEEACSEASLKAAFP